MDIIGLEHSVGMDASGILFLADQTISANTLAKSIIRYWSEIDYAIRTHMTTIEISYGDCLMMVVKASQKSTSDNPFGVIVDRLKKKYGVTHKFTLRKLVTLLLPRNKHDKSKFMETLGFTRDSFPHYNRSPWWSLNNLTVKTSIVILMAIHEIAPERLCIPVAISDDE